MRFVRRSFSFLAAGLLSSGFAAAQAPAEPTRPDPSAAGTDPAEDPPGARGPLPDSMDSIAKAVDTPYRPKPGGHRIKFNLEDADLAELVNHISGLTGKRFIYGGKLRQIKATVYAPEKVTVAEAYSAFLSILASNDLTVIPHGRFLKIVETPGAVSETTPVFGAAAPVPAEDRFVTRMYRLSHIDANDAGGVLSKFKSKDGDVTVYTTLDLAAQRATGSNIQRMLRIVEEIDVGGAGDQLWVQPVHYGSAAEVATKLNEIVDPSRGAAGGGRPGRGGAGGTGARIIADDRTNSLIITATEPDYLRVLGILKRLDVAQTGEGQVHVLSLQHAGCKELSATLNQVLGGGGGGGPVAGGRPGARATPAVPGSTDDIFEGQVKVTCDEASNKLLITSSPHDYAQLRTVIDELDEPRRQVFIEAVIMDLNVSRSLDFGIGYHAGAPFDGLRRSVASYPGPVWLVAPEGAAATALDRPEPPNAIRRNRADGGARREVEVLRVPFLPQDRYDLLLWACDVNFVRGEDSFVRAQWAARPFVWNVYPTEDGAHWLKMSAFLARYAEALDRTHAGAVTALWEAWNRGAEVVQGHPARPAVSEAWPAFAARLAALEAEQKRWSDRLGTQRSLAEQLADFVDNVL